jgi:transcriptional regulator with AAA-type ATPase domain
MGMTTIKDIWGNEYTFKMPNYVIKKLYFDYFTQLCLQRDFPPILDKLRVAIKNLVFEGNIKPFTEVIEMALTKAHSNRDKMQYSEKHLKTLMLGLLFMYETYLIHSEYETNSVYPDIFLERIPQAYLKYEIAIELKYVSKRDASKKVNENSEKTLLQQAVEDGTAQINKYMKTERLNRPDVKGFCLVFVANKCKVIILPNPNL